MGEQLRLLLAACICFLPLHGYAVPQILQPASEVLSLSLSESGSEMQAQEKNETRSNACSYTVSIKTSCSSPKFTRDAISLFFGDFYRNQVYAPRLDDPASRAFERCSTDTFRIFGPCGGRTCYLYLFRSGYDGWTPEYVQVFYLPGDSRTSVTFFYKVPIPAGVWYGFDLCHGGAATLTSVPPSLAQVSLSL